MKYQIVFVIYTSKILYGLKPYVNWFHKCDKVNCFIVILSFIVVVVEFCEKQFRYFPIYSKLIYMENFNFVMCIIFFFFLHRCIFLYSKFLFINIKMSGEYWCILILVNNS
jgi:hypothetical protein